MTSTFVITSADNGKTFSNLRISTTTGECISIIGASNVTIKASNIGPCGEDNSLKAANGIHITASTGIKVYDSYIHVETRASGCCDSHDGILIDQGSSDLDIQGNVITFGEANIEVQGALGPISKVRVVGNFFLNPQGEFPRGQNFQSWAGTTHNSQITVSDNYSLSCSLETGVSGIACPGDTAKYLRSENQEDAINFGFTDSITVEDNWITGGHNLAGCGIILDEASSYAVIQRNVLSNTGQCGIGIASGNNHLVSKNRILNLGSPENVGIYVWNQYPEMCDHLTITENISSVLAQGSHGCDPHTESCNYNGYHDFGNCGLLTEADNTFDNGLYAPGGGPAFQLLDPISTTTPPPSIPPKPKSCVIASPYSTQRSMLECALIQPTTRRSPL